MVMVVGKNGGGLSSVRGSWLYADLLTIPYVAVGWRTDTSLPAIFRRIGIACYRQRFLPYYLSPYDTYDIFRHISPLPAIVAKLFHRRRRSNDP